MNICFPPRFFCSVASDECSMHVREAFRDLAKLANLRMFCGFPKRIRAPAANTIRQLLPQLVNMCFSASR
jgi:hypothetical protein